MWDCQNRYSLMSFKLRDEKRDLGSSRAVYKVQGKLGGGKGRRI